MKKLKRDWVSKACFIIGILIIVFIIISSFIDVSVESGANYNVKSPLLGILIFYNPFILGLYILISIVLILKGIH